MITINTMPHRGKELTGKYMYRMAEGYPEDIAGLDKIPFEVWYHRVKNIPFQSDDDLFSADPDRVMEVVARPGLLIDPAVFPSLDCKKKSILIGAWAVANHRPFCFLAVSEIPSKEVHHVLPAVDFGDGWVMTDATLPAYNIGPRPGITYMEELSR